MGVALHALLQWVLTAYGPACGASLTSGVSCPVQAPEPPPGGPPVVVNILITPTNSQPTNYTVQISGGACLLLLPLICMLCEPKLHTDQHGIVHVQRNALGICNAANHVV